MGRPELQRTLRDNLMKIEETIEKTAELGMLEWRGGNGTSSNDGKQGRTRCVTNQSAT